MKNSIYCFIIIFICSSCARTYNTINPELYSFDNKKTVNDNLNVSYFYDIQYVNRNKPYSRKEKKKNYKLITLKVENNSNKVIKLNRDNFFVKTSSGNSINIIRKETYTNYVRQNSFSFILFYGLAGIGAEWGEINGQSYSRLTYNFLPLLIGIGNAIFAEVSNINHKDNLDDYWIFGKSIPPNSVVYGMLAIQNISYPELNFTYIEEEQQQLLPTEIR